jgi:tetratricopeptide (TPR) repeat protein
MAAMTSLRALTWFAALLPPLLVCAPAVARADESSAPNRALQLHDEAKALYAKGKYSEAVDKLRLAVELDPNARVLYYNLGLIEEKLGHIDAALAYLRRCLELEQKDEERASLKRMIKRLEGAKKYVDFGEEALAPIIIRNGDAPDDDGDDDGGSMHPLLPWTYAAGGTSVVAAIISVGLGAAASDVDPGNEPTTRAGTSVDDLEADAHEAHNLGIGADVTLGIAAGALAATLVLALVVAHDAGDGEAGAFFVEPGGRWGWRF